MSPILEEWHALPMITGSLVAYSIWLKPKLAAAGLSGLESRSLCWVFWFGIVLLQVDPAQDWVNLFGKILGGGGIKAIGSQ